MHLKSESSNILMKTIDMNFILIANRSVNKINYCHINLSEAWKLHTKGEVSVYPISRNNLRLEGDSFWLIPT